MQTSQFFQGEVWFVFVMLENRIAARGHRITLIQLWHETLLQRYA